ncbi:TonB family protein [Hymenobacter endophyticus]|uniref:TonB family protein n=1 Tax=Hymenobacter endophyticus TaxID=3076335 RepID=A0ABU3TF89_9BACT|nr:TonB family protein [Hymenobacter endophyticus]MDU0370019.1 TonB family protein [Hymenobacter endophyticus]
MHYFFLGLGICISGTAEATTLPDSAKITRRIAYQDKSHRRQDSAEGAAYRRETVLIDSLRGTERIYYLPSGKLYSFEAFLNLKSRLKHGAYLEYFESGQMRLQESYVQGKVQGQRLTYYPSGVLRRREQVLPDQPTTGECFGPDGQPIPYVPYQVMPAYPGGLDVLLRDVAMNTRYPAGALRAGVEGVVLIKFIVSKTGQLEDIQPTPLPAETKPYLKRTYAYLQDAAVQSVRKLKPFTPGQLEGEPVAVYYTIPVTFRIK